jgi:predicted DNA binding protein
MNNYVKNERRYFISAGVFDCDENSIDQFCKDLRKIRHARTGRRLELLERTGNFFMIITSLSETVEQKLLVSAAYDPQLIHYRPVIWHPDGWEEWHIACIDRSPLERIIQVCRKIYKIKLVGISQRKITNVGFMTIIPELTTKQKEAIHLAIQHDYYSIPRGIGLEKLATISHKSLSTYQAHLRKAEKKLIPYIFSQTK